jgi:hypothetical protein
MDTGRCKCGNADAMMNCPECPTCWVARWDKEHGETDETLPFDAPVSDGAWDSAAEKAAQEA